MSKDVYGAAEKADYAIAVKEMDPVDVDAVFGYQGEGHVNYTSMGWIKAAVILLKTQIALGVLAMPTALQSVGAVPGALVIFGIALLTSWAGYVVGTFKRNHPEVYSMAEVGGVLAGKMGQEVFTAIYAAFMISLTGVALLPITIAFNALSDHATCTLVWMVLAAVVCCALAFIQTLNKVSLIGSVGVGCILVAIFTLLIAVGVQERPATAPPAPAPWFKDMVAFKKASFWDGVNAMSTAVAGLCGTPAFFSVISEMKNPKDYNKSLAVCQTIVVSTYVTVAVVVYYFCGQYLASPALGSAGPLLKKVCYGIALPGLFATGILYCHIAAKLVFVRLMRKSEHLTAHTKTHWLVWLGTTSGCMLLGFILANSIPFFGNLIVLVCALFGTLMCMQFTGWMWLFDNWHRRKENPDWKFWVVAVFNWLLIVFGSFLMISGVVSSCLGIRDSFRAGTISRPFSCADNSK
ncbi:N amino acid transport system protein [Vanrija pseudolonga]|uniref:N amino acid transport system protein n=1 Tax=Vanrija pseudolonga TaxID=143232 RepID=A0AAF0YA28_9TREE|nr:N amino acid transport system protein [Vanrija pseudolonga]